MPALVRATGPLLERILDDTFPTWGEGLSRASYGRWNVAQERTEWGSRRLARWALVDRDELLASAKRYDLMCRIDGREVRAVGIGAVFTPPARRGRGHARAIIETICQRAKADGAEVALLFSEIGTDYYERLGFHVVPVTTVEIAVRRGPGAPAVLVRAGEVQDAANVAAMYAQRATGFRLALLPDAAQVRYAIQKKRLFTGLDTTGRRAVEYFVAEEGHQAVAFVVLQITRTLEGMPEGWSLEAAGDRDPSGARIGAMLQVLIARTPAGPPPLIRAWWPMALQPPQLAIAARAPAAEVMMVKLLDGRAAFGTPLEAADVIFWHGDAF
jgi:GNAT superfamily N-acetyltransferase